MEITVTYKDTTYFSIEEAITNNKNMFGEDAIINVSASSSKVEDQIYFLLNELVIAEQLDAFFEFYPYGYDKKIEKIKIEALSKVESILDQVLKDNLNRVNE